MLNYVSADRIRQYLVDYGEPVTPEQIARMVNWFAEGAVTTLSNYIMTVFDESPTMARLEYNIAQNCRCMCCHEFQILDEEGNVLDSTEDLASWVRE